MIINPQMVSLRMKLSDMQVLPPVPASITLPSLQQAFILAFLCLGRDCLFLSLLSTLQNKTEPWPQLGTASRTETEAVTSALVCRSLTKTPAQAWLGKAAVNLAQPLC